MKCPFCAQTVDDEAVVCRTCRRDISIPKPVLDANRALQQKIEALEVEIARLHRQVPPRGAWAEPGSILRSIRSAASAYVVLPVVVLIAAHLVLVILLDTNLIYLRIATALLPMIFGYALQITAPPRWYVTGGFACTVGIVSVIAMSTMMWAAYGTPVLPQNGFQEREMAEYATSIALAYILGAFLASGAMPAGRSGGLVELLATFAVLNTPRRSDTLEQRMERWEKIIRFAASLITGAGVIYTGFKRFLE